VKGHRVAMPFYEWRRQL